MGNSEGRAGIYYSRHFDYLNSLGMAGDWMYRHVNETGYLHIALKAGLIGAVLYFLTVAHATYKSLLIPDKRFAVGLMLLLVIHLGELMIVGQPSFFPGRVLLSMWIGLAMSTPLMTT